MYKVSKKVKNISKEFEIVPKTPEVLLNPEDFVEPAIKSKLEFEIILQKDINKSLFEWATTF